MKSHQISESLFQRIKKNVPLSCVDLILVKNGEFLLVKRTIPPYKNKWCLPGGIIKKNQKIIERLNEVAKNELGVKVKIKQPLGFYEKIFKDRHDISHCYVVSSVDNDFKLDFQAAGFKFFKKIPDNIALFYVEMLKDAGFS
jgi:8-oxo-dGTP diphosphatase